MAGSPIKRARREIREQALLRAAAIDQAILEGYERGIDPVTLALPVAQKIYRMAIEGDPENPNTLGACREFMDGVSGKIAQEIKTDAPREALVSMALLGAASELLTRIPAKPALVEHDVTPKGEAGE